MPDQLVPRVVCEKMRTVLSVVAVIAVLIGVAIVLSGCPKEQPPPDAEAVGPEPEGVMAPEGEEAEVEEGVEGEEVEGEEVEEGEEAEEEEEGEREEAGETEAEEDVEMKESEEEEEESG